MKTLLKAGAALVLGVAVVGCASTGGGGMSDADQVMAIVDQWEASIVAQDITDLVPHYSEKYEDANAGNRDEWQAFIQGLIDADQLANAEVGREDAELTIEADNPADATYGPIDFSAEVGAFTIEIYFEKEDGVWKVVSSDVY